MSDKLLLLSDERKKILIEKLEKEKKDINIQLNLLIKEVKEKHKIPRFTNMILFNTELQYSTTR
jgi:hypothetical protein